MGDLTPIAFDIETSGTGEDAVLTVAGFAHPYGVHIILNTANRSADAENLRQELDHPRADCGVELVVTGSEAEALAEVSAYADDPLNADTHYITAYNGETWNGGFDLPFCRTAYIRNDSIWPFAPFAYADVFEMVDRFNTFDESGLVAVYDALIGGETNDPFDDSAEAVYAFEHGHWLPLLQHNLADIYRTRRLAVLCEQFVPESDFPMKSLTPPTQ